MSVNTFNAERLISADFIGEENGVKVYQSTPKMFFVEDKENDTIITVALKARGFETQRVYIAGKLVIGTQATSGRKLGKSMVQMFASDEFQPSDRKSSGSKKVKNDDLFLEFIAEKYEINLDEMRVEFELEQEKKLNENAEIERQIEELKKLLRK